MGNTTQIFSLSVGRKILMSITGLFLCSFLVIHLVGNLSLFYSDGGQAFNEYTKFMSSNWFIRIMEIVLLAGFVLHIYMGYKLTRQNNAARPIKYQVSKVNETSSVYSRNMGITGTIILVFLIIHLKTFWYEYKFGAIGMDAWGNKDMYSAVVVVYQEWWFSLFYVLSMILLGAHLNHGFQSAFKSIGLSDKKYAPVISKIGTGFALLMTIGFSAFPILFYIGCVGNN